MRPVPCHFATAMKHRRFGRQCDWWTECGWAYSLSAMRFVMSMFVCKPRSILQNPGRRSGERASICPYVQSNPLKCARCVAILSMPLFSISEVTSSFLFLLKQMNLNKLMEPSIDAPIAFQGDCFKKHTCTRMPDPTPAKVPAPHRRQKRQGLLHLLGRVLFHKSTPPRLQSVLE